jgi:hypothetical protein
MIEAGFAILWTDPLLSELGPTQARILSELILSGVRV